MLLLFSHCNTLTLGQHAAEMAHTSRLAFVRCQAPLDAWPSDDVTMFVARNDSSPGQPCVPD